MNRAEKKAIEIIEKFGISKPPVPVDQIAQGLGAKLTFEPFEGKDDISGMLFCDGNVNIIGINSAHPKTRQRFSIAHEIGHLVLHKQTIHIDKVVKVDFRDTTSSMAIDRKEIAANAFAAELLMPKTFIKKEIIKEVTKNKSINDKDVLIKRLASSFDVSIQAMEFRLINLGFLISN